MSANVYKPRGPVVDSQTLAILAATLSTIPTPSAGAMECDVCLVFGTVGGSYGTPTIQCYTSLDGINFLTLGGAITPVVTTGEINSWSIWAPIGTNATVTTSAVSAAAALAFGLLTMFTFACGSGYGTSAPATITMIFR